MSATSLPPELYLPATRIDIIERDISRDVQPYVYDDDGNIKREKTAAEFDTELKGREGARRFAAQITVGSNSTRILSGWFRGEEERKVAMDTLGMAITDALRKEMDRISSEWKQLVADCPPGAKPNPDYVLAGPTRNVAL